MVTKRIRIDDKYIIKAVNRKTKKKHSHYDGVLFLCQDKLLPEVLMYYYNRCKENKVGEGQLNRVSALISRVQEWQQKNEKKVKLPD